MFCLTNWILSDIKSKEMREDALRKRKEQHMMETGIIDGLINDERNSTPLMYRILKMWAYFELILLALVLFYKNYKNTDFHQNFMSALCTGTGNKGCKTIVMKAILFHILTTLALLISTKRVCIIASLDGLSSTLIRKKKNF